MHDSVMANYSRASRKDFRDAVRRHEALSPAGRSRAHISRGQIFYRAAEMLEVRRGELESGARAVTIEGAEARREATLAIDRLVYYAGWTDNFANSRSVNPVATLAFQFHGTGTNWGGGGVRPDEPRSLPWCRWLPRSSSGNTVIVLPSTTNALAPLTFSEIIATSDLPPGVVNILAGDRTELAPHFASHMDVNAIVDASGDEKSGGIAARRGFNVKRYVRRARRKYRGEKAENPYWILDTVEMKTAWHPIGTVAPRRWSNDKSGS